MNQDYIHSTTCRICGGSNLTQILDLGQMPPANSFLKKEDLGKEEKKFPLAVHFCNTCSLLQLLHVVNPEIIFRNYDYLTSASKPLVTHFTNAARSHVKKFITDPHDVVVEIGGNDGVLLESIKDTCKVLNIEPARNIVELSRARGVETINDFFTSELAKQIVEKYGHAKMVIANNVMAHIDDIRGVFQGVKTLIGNEGVFIFEVHWVGNLIGEGGFDQIYHEHLCYHSLTALTHLVAQFGLNIFDMEIIPIHGQSMRVYIGACREATPAVAEFLKKEKELGLDTVKPFLAFSEKVEKNKVALITLLQNLKKEGKKIAGYGAPAKGNTMLNYFGIDASILDFLTDTTPLKQGAYSPGMHIPVVSPTKIAEEWPDYMLLLAWNYADAIIQKEAEYREHGGKFIVPVPELRVV